VGRSGIARLLSRWIRAALRPPSGLGGSHLRWTFGVLVPCACSPDAVLAIDRGDVLWPERKASGTCLPMAALANASPEFATIFRWSFHCLLTGRGAGGFWARLFPAAGAKRLATPPMHHLLGSVLGAVALWTRRAYVWWRDEGGGVLGDGNPLTRPGWLSC